MQICILDSDDTVINVLIAADGFDTSLLPLADGQKIGPAGGAIGFRWTGDEYVRPSVEEPVTADDVRAEAQRRLMALFGARSPEHLQIVISNGVADAVELQEIKLAHIQNPTANADWTLEQATRAAQLATYKTLKDTVRAASDVMEANPPADYKDDSHWPTATWGL